MPLSSCFFFTKEQAHKVQMNLILQGSLCAHLSILTDKRESHDKKLGEFQKSLGVFLKNLGELLEKVGDFLRTLGDFDRSPRKRKGFSLKG